MLDTTTPFTRRRWIESAAFLAAGTVLGAGSFAAINAGQTRKEARKGAPSPPPSEAALASEEAAAAAQEEHLNGVLQDSAKELSYVDFLEQFDLRHIQPQEILNPHRQTTQGITNTLPPIELWSAMPTTLFVADEIRERLGRPLKLITSAYRNPTYNRACGGAAQSWHTKNCALDLVFEGGPREAHAIAHELRNTGYFQGGIGLYKTFIHIDSRGENATWRG